MKREIIRVEPLSTYLERVKAPASVATRHNDTIYVSGLPPFDPETGEVASVSIERQTEPVSRFRSSYDYAATSFTNFGIERTLENL